MSDRKPKDESNTSQMKKRRLDGGKQQITLFVEEPVNQLTIATVPNQRNGRTRPQICKLDVDSVQEMFDWLSIRDIHSISETCIRMKRIAADYFEPHLAAILLGCGELRTDFGNVSINGFKEFVPKLLVHSSVNDKGYRSIGQHCRSLKQICFDYTRRLSVNQIEHIKPILSQIETLRFNYSHVKDELFESFLQFCPNLKYLSIASFDLTVAIGSNNEWLLRRYSKLQHFEIHLPEYFPDIFQIPELRTFFEQNASLQKLSINETGFLQCITTLLQTKMRLQTLALKLLLTDESIHGHLEELHDRGCYQRLHLQMECVDQQSIDRISALQGLEKLYLNTYNASDFDLRSMKNLKELGFNNFDSVHTFSIDLQLTAKSLENLERLYFCRIKSEWIEPFIQHSAKLKAIKINFLDGQSCIDLSALNQIRERLVSARKVTIYLQGKAYLDTKWSSKTNDFKMIEVKRAESYDWQIPFSY